jgi:nitrogen fixation NifU-like protein
MPDLSELYQQIILDHNRNPRNFRPLESPDRVAEGYNPLCGDKITVYLKLQGDRVKEVAFQGSGCAISQASASLMTGVVAGRTTGDAERLFRDFQAMATAEPGASVDTASLGKLAAFAGVRQFPVRVKCATLAWHTLHAALQNAAAPVSTE